MVTTENLENKDHEVHLAWTAMLVLLDFLVLLDREDPKEKKERGV